VGGVGRGGCVAVWGVWAKVVPTMRLRDAMLRRFRMEILLVDSFFRSGKYITVA
jgi:hypothetical protein